MTSPPPGRYRVTLHAAGRAVAHGWWDPEETARRKLATWIGDWGRPGARITLTDEETGETLTERPEPE
ncbi:hypothetical protein ACH49_13650 [Streptomyces leeuwenhoekii]|uniref:Uncharacterized protein n=1 Tax=Streptomyces leeuwenhoekii TaxID=1437453 RepID=A0ABR5HYZ9_STRLW|nr:hypothetical protein [Streptomyces leeuwenhoekii]KMS79093.1 hypothetical protein ACH49_13650 [Streptomyces leeuwenhoekii]